MREVGRYVRPGKAGVTVCGMGVFWHTAAMKIYTKAGDDGMTSLLGGTRVAKDAPRVEAYGTVDELNAALGLAASVPVTAEARSILHLLHRLQHLLFDLGADLAAPGPREPDTVGRVTAAHVAEVEAAIDAADAKLPALRSFILPGGSELASRLHLARTVCRRAERRLVTLQEVEHTHDAVGLIPMIFLNRVGDLLFVLARAANAAAGVDDVAWKPDGTT